MRREGMTCTCQSMCMSVLERRLQILLDAQRYDRLANEAATYGRSVAAVVREAIDLRFPDDEGQARAAAARALLDLTVGEETTDGRGEGPAELKAAYEEALSAKVGS